MAITYKRIDNEDYSKVIASQTKVTAVADRNYIDRENFDYVVDQLLGAAAKTRRRKIDIADMYKYLKDAVG